MRFAVSNQDRQKNRIVNNAASMTRVRVCEAQTLAVSMLVA